MRNRKKDEISNKKKREIEKQRLKKASVIDEITVNVLNNEKNLEKDHNKILEEDIDFENEKVRRNKRSRNEIDKFQNKKNSTKKKKHRNKKIAIVLKVILVILLVIIIRVAYKFFKGMNQNGWTIGGFVATMLGHDANTLANLSRINILLIGQSQNLTDTLLVCSYDPKTQDAVMLSIPRDTFVGRSRASASAFDKINAVYQVNPEKLMQNVRDLTGLDIEYYIKVDTAGLRELVDSVGGVYFDVPIDMDYDDSTQDLYIHVKKGYQLLDGSKAEQVVRFRHNNDGSTYPREYGEQDIGRMKTQRAFLIEVFKQLVKPKNITAVDDYIKIANKNVETNFNIWNLKDYAPYLLEYKIENLQSATLPGVPEKINELWFYSCNKKETEKLVAELFKTGLAQEDEANTKIKVKILNGTSNDNNLVNLQKVLKEKGYTIESTGKTSLTKTTTILNRTKQKEEVANKLQETIGVGIIANSTGESDSDVDFTIIIGDDYT